MQPAELAVTLRRRTPWEATDLGLAMLQRWWRQAYGAHLAVCALVAALAAAAAWLTDRAWLAIVVIWWLKPVNDRVVLHVLSRAVFGEVQDVRAVLARPGQWLATGLAASLTLGRFDSARSFNLPVRQLEGQRWRAARERASLLGRRVRGYAVWLTLVCLAFEWLVLYFSLSIFAELLLPAKSAEHLGFFQSLFSDDAWSAGDALAYGLAVAFLEPFYVAAGFALYLNRRSVLEGWDIEVALRRIAERHTAALLTIMVSLGGILFVETSFAQKDPKAEIREVLKAPEFPHERDVMEWRPRKASPERGPNLKWLEALGYALANAGRVLFWIAAVAALGYALWWAARLMPRMREPRPEAYRPPAALFGMGLAPETLPEDVAAAAAALAAEDRVREALGLLYRGALSELVHRRGVMLLPSHTEAEVLSLSPSTKHSYMKDLIDLWRQCAYALRTPARSDVERLAARYREFLA